MKQTLFVAAIVILVALAGCARQNTVEEDGATLQIRTDSRGVKDIVDPDKIRSGVPPKDGIPSIDNPVFVSPQEADRWIEDNELVLVLQHRGVKRMYPLQILVWHEIVNDTIAGEPIPITYCPLCGSGIAYRREFEGKAILGPLTGRKLAGVFVDTVSWGLWKVEHPDSPARTGAVPTVRTTRIRS